MLNCYLLIHVILYDIWYYVCFDFNLFREILVKLQTQILQDSQWHVNKLDLEIKVDAWRIRFLNVLCTCVHVSEYKTVQYHASKKCWNSQQ